MRLVILEDAVKVYPGGRRAFCKAAGITGGRLSQIIGGEKPSPELAIRFHRLTAGAVPASSTRPDLWRAPEDVPVEQAEAAQ
jgi:hypothetical protein